ncbi:hypothetical protein MBLNU230_g5512t1 [Neophaeotheca triangularis]
MQQRSPYSGTPSSSLYSSQQSINTATTQSTTSQRPTYLDYSGRPPVPERSPSRGLTKDQDAVPQTAAFPVQTNNTLLIAVAGTPSIPLIKTYVQRMLNKTTVSEIAILGITAHETLFKQLKMDMYGLAGKLGRDMGVQVYLREAWSPRAVAAAVEEVVSDVRPTSDGFKATSRDVGAVVCFPRLSDGRAGHEDVLELSSEDLQANWLSSVAFVHGIGKACLPKMREGLGTGQAFFLTAYEHPREEDQSLNLPAVEALMEKLAKGFAGAVVVGRAEIVLPPEPEPEVVRAPVGVPAQGPPSLQIQTAQPRDDETPPESPSKLWSMWQMQNELGYAD